MVIVQTFEELLVLGVAVGEELVELIVVDFVGLGDGFEEGVVFVEFGVGVVGEEVEVFWFLVVLVLDRF